MTDIAEASASAADRARMTLEAKISKVLSRLNSSLNKYVRTKRFNRLDKAALALLIKRGDVEIFDSPLGRAYRLVSK